MIDSIAASVERVEAGEDVTLTATVRDAETPVSQLQYEWSAPAGTFASDQPGTARWSSPTGVATPAEYRIRLTVIERYGPGDAQEHRVSADGPVVRVHDSVRELSDLSISFLTAFSTSSVPPADAIRDFSDRCPGKEEELEDVRNNRSNYEITSYWLGAPTVSIQYGGGCRVPGGFLSPRDACMAVPVEWHSTDRRSGAGEVARGTSILTGVYHDGRWWLCDSRFDAPSPISPRFIR